MIQKIDACLKERGYSFIKVSPEEVDDGDIDIAGIGIWIPVCKYVEPCIQRRQYAQSNGENYCEYTFFDTDQVVFEYFQYCFHFYVIPIYIVNASARTDVHERVPADDRLLFYRSLKWNCFFPVA